MTPVVQPSRRSGRRRFIPAAAGLTLVVLIPAVLLAVGLVPDGAQQWLAAGLWTGGSPPVPDAFGWSVAAGDFDGDGVDDLAIGDPTADLGAATEAGVVTVIYGGSGGLANTGSQLWHQDTGAVPDVAESFDWFGYALAVGDFDGDAYDDLAIGTPLENDGAVSNSGSVQVLYGSAAGLSDLGAQDWHQNVPDVPDTNESDDLLGWSVTSGDFDGDGYDDLAIGVVSENFGNLDIGRVLVLYGSASGLFAAVGSTQVFGQGLDGLDGVAEDFDYFGEVLSSGDYDDDGYDDLAVGVPSENFYGSNDGLVSVIPGSSAGLTTSGNVTLQQTGWVANFSETDDEFGRGLASGDFDGDGRDELAIGAAGEDSGEGRVHVFQRGGSSWSVQLTRLDQDVSGMAGAGDLDERFGHALVAGDFDGDGWDDLAIGVPGDHPSSNAAGAVNVVYGSPTGLTTAGNQIFGEDALGLPGTFGHPDELFGWALAAGDFDGDGADDLGIGIPSNQESSVEIGGVDVLYSIGLCPNGVVDGGEECDDDNLTDEDGCSSACLAEYCGDGVIQAGLGENCDDSNTVPGDGCSDVCIAEFCGDGVVQAGLGESCDDGNTMAEDGCSDVCIAEYCGDGVVQAGLGETCDDGNAAPEDGCSATCWDELGSVQLYGVSMGGSVSITIAGVVVTVQTLPGMSSSAVFSLLQAGVLADPTLSALGVQAAVVGSKLYVSEVATNYGVSDAGLFTTPPSATTASYTDATAFAIALPGAPTTQAFDALTGGGPVGMLGPLTFTTFAPVEPPLATEAFATSSPTVSLGADNVDEVLLDGDPLYVSLAQPADAIALRVVTSDPALVGELILVTPSGAGTNVDLVESTLSDGGYVYFLGLVSDTPFTDAVLGFDDDAKANFVYTVDDVTVHFVPEPGRLPSLVGGIAFLVWARRRRTHAFAQPHSSR